MTMLLVTMLVAIGGLSVAVMAVLAVIHLGFRAPRVTETGSPADFGVAFKTVRIPGKNGATLHAWLLPEHKNRATIIMLHGWGGNAEMMLPLALPLYKSGFQILLPDARNHGRSSSDGFSSLPKFAEDVDAAIDWLKTQTPEPQHKIVLLGHSIGAAAVLLAASRRTDIAAVISLAAFAHPDSLMRRQLAHLPLPETAIRAILAYVQFRIGHSFDEIAPANTLCDINCPVLLAHGTADRIVPCSDLKHIEKNCGNDHTRFLAIEGAGHVSLDKINSHTHELVQFLLDNRI